MACTLATLSLGHKECARAGMWEVFLFFNCKDFVKITDFSGLMCIFVITGGTVSGASVKRADAKGWRL